MHTLIVRCLALFPAICIMTACTTFDPFNRQKNLPQVALPVESTVEHTDLPPLTSVENLEAAAENPATDSLITRLARPWTLSDEAGQISCALVLTNTEISGTALKRVNAGGSCFNKLNFVTGWAYAEQTISLYNDEREVMAQLKRVEDNLFTGQTQTGLSIKIYY